jgi:hypothetical protein
MRRIATSTELKAWTFYQRPTIANRQYQVTSGLIIIGANRNILKKP